MQYDFPSHAAGSGLPDWPRGIGGIPVQLSNGIMTELPVLPGTNVLTFGVVGTGKTRSYTMPAAEVLLSHVPGMRGVFFEIKRSFLQRFLQPDDKIITYDPASVPADNLFRPCLIREIRQANNRESEMRQIAEFLFADLLEGANQNRSWIEAARNTWIAVLRTIVDCYGRTSPAISGVWPRYFHSSKLIFPGPAILLHLRRLAAVPVSSLLQHITPFGRFALSPKGQCCCSNQTVVSKDLSLSG